MRIAYCTNVRLPNERAHGHQIAKVTQALHTLGHHVEIYCPFRKNPIDQNFAAYYGLSSPIPLHQLGSIDGIAAWWAPGVVGLKLTTALFARKLKKSLAQRKKDFDCIYTRTPELLPVLTATGIPVVMELHRIPRFGIGTFQRQMNKCRLVVALTSPMRTGLIDMGLVRVPVITEGDAVDLHEFENVPPAADTRKAFDIPQGVPLIGYAGQLESMGLSKGIPELLDACKALRKRGFEFRAVIVGGPQNVRQRMSDELDPSLRQFVKFAGHLPRAKIPTFLHACDALVYPAPDSKHPFYVRDTSPLKIFEYMASGRPIVSADLPPIRDILDESTALLCPPGNAEAMADAIRAAVAHPEPRAKLAKSRVANFTWIKRMERILGALSIA